MLFEVAPADAHAFAAARLKAAGVHVPRACLLRRVAADLGPPGCEGLVQGLEKAGLRGDRLSVWALQVELPSPVPACGGRRPCSRNNHND